MHLSRMYAEINWQDSLFFHFCSVRALRIAHTWRLRLHLIGRSWCKLFLRFYRCCIERLCSWHLSFTTVRSLSLSKSLHRSLFIEYSRVYSFSCSTLWTNQHYWPWLYLMSLFASQTENYCFTFHIFYNRCHKTLLPFKSLTKFKQFVDSFFSTIALRKCGTFCNYFRNCFEGAIFVFYNSILRLYVVLKLDNWLLNKR